MMTWAARRRLLYLSIVFVPIILIIGMIGFFAWYEDPTCFDKKQNGDELGIDCGGSCVLLCTSQALAPEILWSRSFEILPGVYNLVAYIENPNVQSEVLVAPYSFKVFGENNELILERKGTTNIPQRKTFAIFEGTVRTDGKVPSRVSFEFTRELIWQRVEEKEPDIEVQSTVLVGTDSSPRIDSVLQNKSIDNLENVEVIVIVFDSDNNAINVSRTIVEKFDQGSKRELVFTWPQAFDTGFEVCENPVDTTLVIDRSGSMNDDNEDPPEPLTTVKESAKTFVDQLKGQDKVSVVSFATEGSLDIGLNSNSPLVQSAIDSISIGPNENTQYTNILDGLTVAYQELTSERDDPESDNVIVLLTDGIASRPIDQSNVNFAEDSAIAFAEEIQDSVEIYTIGLGTKVNSEFLKQIATGDQYYYTAPTRLDLEAIYQQIATAICKKGPNVIQIIPRVPE